MKISVIVPTLNRREDLSEFLDTLLAQTRLPEELVIVDAGTDHIDDLVRARLVGSPIEFKYDRSEPGTSLQRNIGVGMSDGEILFFLDDDGLYEPDYIERTLECFALDFDPPVGGVMGSALNPTVRRGLKQQITRAFGLTHTVGGDTPGMYSSGGVIWLACPSRPVPVPVAATGRVAYRRQCMLEEQFSEYMPGYTHAEDVELAFRIGRRWTILQTPDAQVEQKFSPVSRISFGNRAGRVVYSHFYFFKHHRPHDLYHLGAFAWANVGLAALTVGEGLKKGGARPAIAGLFEGYRRCLTDLRGGS